MADIQIEAGAHTSLNQRVQPRSLVWTTSGTGYMFFIDSSNDFEYRKTADGGVTWGAQQQIHAGTIATHAIWFDQWTDNTGDLIHLAYTDTARDDIVYHTLDTSDDTLSAERVVFAGATFAAGDWTDACISVVRARGGNVYVGGFGDGDGEKGVWKSTDTGSNWIAIDSFFPNIVKRLNFTPGSGTDTNDIGCVIWDDLNSDLFYAFYDQSGDTWSSGAINRSVLVADQIFQMDSTYKLDNFHTYLVAKPGAVSSTNILFLDIEGIDNMVSGTDIAIEGGVNNVLQPSILLNNQNGDIYCTYISGTNWQTNMDIVYTKSIDNGSNWGAVSQFNVNRDDHREIFGGTSIVTSGGRFQPCWFNDDTNDIMTNRDNSIEFGVSGAVPPPEIVTRLSFQTDGLNWILSGQ